MTNRAQSWWEVIQSKRDPRTWTWSEFKRQFEMQFFSSYQCSINEQEFLAFKQGDMSVLEYERRFHDLSLFASQFIATKQHMIDRLRDELH
jgi:hypothetical protein